MLVRVDRRSAASGPSGSGTTHDELVAAESHADVAAAQRAPQTLRHLHEQFVARRVAEHVVHALEAVEVDEEQRDTGPAATHARQRGGHLLDEQRPAPETGEPIVGRVVFEAFLEALALGDVFEGCRGSPSTAPSGSPQRNRAHADPARRAVGQHDAQLVRGRGSRASPRSRRAAARAVARCRRRSRSPTTNHGPAPRARTGRSSRSNAGLTNVHRSSRSISKIPIGLSPTSVRQRASRSNTVWSTARTIVPRTSGWSSRLRNTSVMSCHPSCSLCTRTCTSTSTPGVSLTPLERVEHGREIVVVHPVGDPRAQVVEVRRSRRTRPAGRA